MSDRTLTIAISAKNAHEVIVDCLDSIGLQTVKPDEVFVVVDDEKDSTVNIAKKYGIKILLNKGKRLYDARQTALENCKTDILTFTDTDCVLDRNWVQNIKRVLREHPEVAGGTGSHPSYYKNNIASWLHNRLYIVESLKTGYTDGVIGGNCFFRVKSLNGVEGWDSLSLMGAEDFHIAKKLLSKGRKLWFDESIKAYHKGYRRSFWKLFKQVEMMGHDIMVMMRKTDCRTIDYYYTLAIPFVLFLGIFSIVFLSYGLVFIVFGGSFLFLWHRLRSSFKKVFTAWLARWILIFPYSFGVLRGLLG